ncbi:hypothetical protein FA15DRAFT_670612 [Coprinopsis marcescibilis]|uniref:Nephrocystin 3-like N-terminal domain-containing protein n=1 Tax=Coprinopsis marcescibilis TaxID=230819 RepID=A0A5C3KSA2_COPMA|nr:hypothetical protein FA15DRAFT_670612 [Coprinopsis marcescibilis]
MLSNAQHATINNGIFTEVGRDFYQNTNYHHHGGRFDGMKVLYDHMAPGPLYTSRDRHSAPRTRRGTPQAIIQQDTMRWIRQRGICDNPCKFMWLTGPAGSGMSAIMQAVAEDCDLDEILAATFFFSDSKRDDDDRLIATLGLIPFL